MKKMKVEELNELLDPLTNEERDFVVFRYLLEYPYEYSYLKKNLKNKKNLFKLSLLVERVITEKEDDIRKMNHIECRFNRKQYYKKILLATKKLANELKLNNSLEVANLFTYLLWNGYFSKNKKLIYQNEDRYMISGEYSHDIMSGKGVCLNFADMLSDFINEFDYSSALLINYVDSKKTKINFKPEIKRTIAEESFDEKIYSYFTSEFRKKSGNHAFNLIMEDNKFYIYDPTGLSMFKLKNKNEAKLINGKGVCLLKPFLSYSLNISRKSIETLDSFNISSKFVRPYDRLDFICEWENCIDQLKNNRSLLNDFYYDILKDINYIDKTNEKSKKLL